MLSDPHRALGHVRAFCARFAMRCETPGAHFVSSMPGSVESALHLKCQSSSGWGCCSVDRAITWRARNSVPSLAHKKPWWHILYCMPSPQVVEAGGHPWLHSESEANSGCVRLSQGKKAVHQLVRRAGLGSFLIQASYEGKGQINLYGQVRLSQMGETADEPPGPGAQPKFSSK